MHLFKFLSLLCLFFGARALSSLKTRGPGSHPLAARELLDVCAFMSGDIIIPNAEDFYFPVGAIDVCLCTSSLPLFIQTNPIAVAAVREARGGEPTVTSILTDLINKAAAHSCCLYPDHSIPSCVDGNPCGFRCTDGFTASPPDDPTTCICEAPLVVCNGQCVETISSPLTTKQKPWLGGHTCAEMGPELPACGVFGGGARSWECMNTLRDIHTCGGCLLPPDIDCTSLPSVADVAGIANECVVHRCLPGYVPARDGIHCVSRHGRISPHPEYDEDEAESVPATVYGLEHVPLRKRKY
ncbi:hypothetical protein BGW80DRAFT_1488004 [Lactifluus volemus]|nr:hypothetical protein BGW80DRAFT_1488004 [Lactifluus volemus]